MKIMARIGKEPLKVLLANKKPFVPGTHSVGK
jgi:GTP-dependent phosphoenolpyruvate carboxykinase